MAQLQQFLPILLIIGVFYFLIIRPQQKRASAQRAMLAAIKPGDEIVTVGGLYAVIIEVGERIRVRVADGSELELAKQAIAQVVAPKDAPAPDADDDVEDEAAEPAGGEPERTPGLPTRAIRRCHSRGAVDVGGSAALAVPEWNKAPARSCD